MAGKDFHMNGSARTLVLIQKYRVTRPELAYLRMISELLDTFMIFLFCEYIDTADNNDKAALLSEIQMLKQAGKHPNIVNFVGACTQGGKSTIEIDH